MALRSGYFGFGAELRTSYLYTSAWISVLGPLPYQSSSGFWPCSFGLPRFRFPSTDRFSWHHLYLLSRCLHFSHELQFRLSSFPPQHAHFICVQFPLLLLSNCPTFCTIHHGWLYSLLVNFVFQLCWYVPVAHHPSSFPLL